MISLTDKPKRAVAYYRHSAEDKQENSVEIQRDHVEKFARDHHVEIIAECIDDGLTGTNANRAGFQDLLTQWVNNPEAQFDYVFVLDVSRFGRFKNPDESGMYVFQCSANGHQVIYSKRGFPVKGQELMYHMMEAMERVNATAYISDLSEKVWYGEVKITEQGYSAGGVAPYGMKRILLDENKNYIQDLEDRCGQQKYIANQRVTFAPGDPKKQKVVRQIFDLYVNLGFSSIEIAQLLNESRVKTANGKGKWTGSAILGIIRNRKYAGATVYNRTSHKVYDKRSKSNPRKDWIIKDGAFDGIITVNLFERAQAILALRRSPVPSLSVEPQKLAKAIEEVPIFPRNWIKTKLADRLLARQNPKQGTYIWLKKRDRVYGKNTWEYKLVNEEDTLKEYEMQAISLVEQYLERFGVIGKNVEVLNLDSV